MSTEHGKPTDGMCCLCTMEDITEEDGNYVEYQTAPSMKWFPCMYEKVVVQQLLLGVQLVALACGPASTTLGGVGCSASGPAKFGGLVPLEHCDGLPTHRNLALTEPTIRQASGSLQLQAATKAGLEFI